VLRCSACVQNMCVGCAAKHFCAPSAVSKSLRPCKCAFAPDCIVVAAFDSATCGAPPAMAVAWKPACWHRRAEHMAHATCGMHALAILLYCAWHPAALVLVLAGAACVHDYIMTGVLAVQQWAAAGPMSGWMSGCLDGAAASNAVVECCG
jgi:hypothetical protein